MRPWWIALVLACSLDGPSPANAPWQKPEEAAPAQSDAPAPATKRRTFQDHRSVLARVVQVTDGDTIRVEVGGRNERVRYIGIDTPETRHSPRGPQPFAEEASEANRRLVTGREVRLVFDVEERDRYGRLLAYVYLHDGTFVNAVLVEEGYARTLTVPPNVRHAHELRALEARARNERRGLWGLSDAR